jgi:hypothetical protein|tara:strand:+ start:212 stop:400 length:189 start_codon:yes stop_codon:yes gene_type:complete
VLALDGEVSAIFLKLAHPILQKPVILGVQGLTGSSHRRDREIIALAPPDPAAIGLPEWAFFD